MNAYLETRISELEKRLGRGLRLFRGRTSEVSDGETDFPVEFAGKILGSIRLQGDLSPEWEREIRSFAAQIAALWEVPQIPAAVELDKAVAALHDEESRFDWTGVYRRVGDELRLTVFRGDPTPHPVISTAAGICGAAVRENRSLNIGDVGKDPRYLACDFRTRSELVVPIRDRSGAAIGEIDIDSHVPGEFPQTLVHRVEQEANRLAPLVVQLI